VRGLLGQERVNHVLQQDSDGRRGLPGEPQVPRHDVVPVVELLDGLPHPGGAFRADTAAAVDHRGESHDADPGQHCDIAHRRMSPAGMARTGIVT